MPRLLLMSGRTTNFIKICKYFFSKLYFLYHKMGKVKTHSDVKKGQIFGF